jgi:hypothetical protein
VARRLALLGVEAGQDVFEKGSVFHGSAADIRTRSALSIPE